MEPVLELAEGIAARIGELEGVAAVALGGSWARGGASPDSDADLGIYYEPVRPFAIEDLRRLARELDDRRPDDAVTGFGEWGPWINGGGWLVIGGQRVDWLYRDLAHVRRAIEECRAGRPALHHQPGHPHVFHTHIYLGEIHHCVPLYDPRNVLRDLKPLADPYPPLLKKALVRSQIWKAGFALYTTRSSVERADVFHASGSFFQCVACLVQTLHALNESYLTNEKGALDAVDTLALRPDGFVETASAVLSCPGDSPDRLRVSLETWSISPGKQGRSARTCSRTVSPSASPLPLSLPAFVTGCSTVASRPGAEAPARRTSTRWPAAFPPRSS